MPRTSTKTATNDTAAVDRFAPLTDDDIKDLTDSGSFSRGRSYFRRGAIVDPVLTGDTISAGCWGSEQYPYHVQATLARTGAKDPLPRDCDCTCPRGGFCKHIVALLLTWIDNPLAFEERPPLRESLAERSKDDLIAIIERLVEHDPELYRFVELPIIHPEQGGAPSAVTVDPRAIRRQIDAIIRANDTYEWGGNWRAAQELESIVALATSYAEAGAWADAALVYETVAEVMLDRYGQFWDREGEIAVVISESDNGLAAVLDAQPGLPEGDRLNAEQRRAIFQAIFEIWRYDVTVMGGIDLSQEGPEALARTVNDAERAEVLGWLRGVETPAEPGEFGSNWARQMVVEFEVMLREASGIDDDALLQLYLDRELWEDAASLLLTMDRFAEATTIANQKLAQPAVFLRFADQLFAMGGEHRDGALTLVDDRLWENEGKDPNQDEALLAWLQAKYATTDQAGKALELARRRFKARPSQWTYDAVKAAATLPGQPDELWPSLQAELQATLRENQDWGVAIRVALAERNGDAALDALTHLQKAKSRQPGSLLFLGDGIYEAQVAELVEQSHPDEAIRLYRDLAQRSIDRRNRPAYQTAAERLSRVQRILTANGRVDEWSQIIAAIRSENSRLRALKEELDARKLT